MRVEDISFEFTAILGRTTLPMAACSELEVGDILILDQKVADPLSLQVGEQTYFRGYPGLYEKHKGIKIV